MHLGSLNVVRYQLGYDLASQQGLLTSESLYIIHAVLVGIST